MRSPTAEAVFSGISGLESLSAGTDSKAITPISLDLIEWAELIFVMEAVHRQRLQTQFGSSLRAKRIIVLGIPDDFGYMEPDLIELVTERVTPHLRLSPEQAAQLQQKSFGG